MEISTKPKKVRLAIAPDYDFSLFAVVSSMNIHNLSWAINQQMSVGLKLQEEYVVASKTHLQDKRFLVYACSDDLHYTQITLVSNNSENGKLIKELSNIDYFLRISGDVTTEIVEEWLIQLLDVKGVTMVNKLNLEILGFRNKASFLGVFLDICKTHL